METPSSLKIDNNIVYKFFHRCSFTNCNRTFSSAGWLKSHLSSHFDEIKQNKFNLDFQKFTNLNKKTSKFNTLE